ncbi:MAG: sodium:solute symporter family transporter [Rubricoccaceae bacterium]
MLAWSLFAAYLLGTSYLGWLGFRRTRDFNAFAIGRGDLSPLVVGVTLAASTASAATFIINPGFVYVDGLAAWIHFVPATVLGFCSMLFLLSFRFRRIGAEAGALTLPHWIGKRYRSQAFALYFAIANLLVLAFVVLLVGGISIVMQSLLGVSNAVALAITLVFVTGYVFMGGTYAHVFTNLLQGTLMIGVAVAILATGLPLLLGEPGLADALRAVDPALLAPVNREGQLFNDVFSVYVAGFLVGATITCQPHILTKALYVRTDRAVRSYLLVFTVIFVLFMLLVSVGFFARLVLPAEALIDPATGAFRQDLVMTAYLRHVFPEWGFTVVSVVLLAAAMSTLDGLLVALSTIAANDLLLPLSERLAAGRLSPEARQRFAYRASHAVLLLVAGLTFMICLDPPRLLGIFGQVGVYGLAVAAVPPLVAGVLFRRVSLPLVWAASAGALAVHLGLYFFGARLLPGVPLTFANPGVTVSLAVLVVVLPALLLVWLGARRATGAGDVGQPAAGAGEGPPRAEAASDVPAA